MFRDVFNHEKVKALEKTKQDLEREIETLRTINRAQQELLGELRAQRPMSDTEWGMFKAQTQTIADQQKELNDLAIWLRNNKRREIETGLHVGYSLSQVIIRYLSGSQEIPVRRPQDQMQ